MSRGVGETELLSNHSYPPSRRRDVSRSPAENIQNGTRSKHHPSNSLRVVDVLLHQPGTVPDHTQTLRSPRPEVRYTYGGLIDCANYAARGAVRLWLKCFLRVLFCHNVDSVSGVKCFLRVLFCHNVDSVSGVKCFLRVLFCHDVDGSALCTTARLGHALSWKALSNVLLFVALPEVRGAKFATVARPNTKRVYELVPRHKATERSPPSMDCLMPDVDTN
ncbi:hypothetical protein LSAT2_022793 [Lamellibrachia satsuma]|nr:hypothetical protein LSAT2_022793 [Lamellibrachia satsuma]